MSNIGVPRKLRTYDELKVGQTIQALFNPDPDKFLTLDGGDYNVSDWPELVYGKTGKRVFPGVFTSTARTLAAAPSAAVISTDGTTFLAPATAGTAPIQASADGITWAAGGGAPWGASTQAYSIIFAGTRYVMAGSGGDLSAPYVIASGNLYTNLPTKMWTATTGGTTTTLTQGLAYGSTANAGAGRTVLCKDGSLATSAGLFYMNDGATAWNACSGGSTTDRKAVCWTGQKFICLSASNLQTSSDGVTWADLYISARIINSPTYSFLASDGNGTVVITVADGYQGYVTVSKDHGTTWHEMLLPVEPALFGAGLKPIGSVSYVNGKFMIPITLGTSTWAYEVAISADGLNWFIEPMGTRGIAVVTFGAVAYKAGTYCAIKTGTTALTSVENTSKFRLPKYINAGIAPTVSMTFADPTPRFIKARS